MEIPQETLTLFNEYEQIKLDIKKLENRLDEIKPVIIEFVPEDKIIELQNGHIYSQVKTDWKFSESVDLKKKEMDDLKSEEKAKGIATPSYSKILFYKENK